MKAVMKEEDLTRTEAHVPITKEKDLTSNETYDLFLKMKCEIPVLIEEIQARRKDLSDILIQYHVADNLILHTRASNSIIIMDAISDYLKSLVLEEE